MIMQHNELEIVKIYQKSHGVKDKKNVAIGKMLLLEDAHLSLVMDLQDIIVNDLHDHHIYHPNSIDFLQFCIKKQGRIIGTFIKNKLIAYLIIYFPNYNKDNLGIDLSFPKSLLSKVAHLESVAVHPDYRGNSLALKMSLQALKIMRMLGYHHACVTISPRNIYNLNVVFKSGFIIKVLKIKYGGKLRYILYKDLIRTSPLSPKKTKFIASTNIEAQQYALEQGLVGYKLHQTIEGFVIAFGEIDECHNHIS